MSKIEPRLIFGLNTYRRQSTDEGYQIFEWDGVEYPVADLIVQSTVPFYASFICFADSLDLQAVPQRLQSRPLFIKLARRCPIMYDGQLKALYVIFPPKSDFTDAAFANDWQDEHVKPLLTPHNRICFQTAGQPRLRKWFAQNCGWQEDAAAPESPAETLRLYGK